MAQFGRVGCFGAPCRRWMIGKSNGRKKLKAEIGKLKFCNQSCCREVGMLVADVVQFAADGIPVQRRVVGEIQHGVFHAVAQTN